MNLFPQTSRVAPACALAPLLVALGEEATVSDACMSISESSRLKSAWSAADYDDTFLDDDGGGGGGGFHACVMGPRGCEAGDHVG